MNTGIFGGTFDPVHTEHVRLARAAVQTLRLDRLIVMPAHTPPHKREKTLSSDKARLEMCRVAFGDIPEAEISDYEINEGGTSYTCLTCRRFRQLYPKDELFWLVGTDMLRDFPRWRNPEEILSLATLAVCARAEEKGWEEAAQADFYARFGRRFETIGYDGQDVSSTRVRVYTAAGEDITPFVGERVEEYIRKNGLYEIAGAKEALSFEKPSRCAHSVRVALMAAESAGLFGVDEKKAITAALFHDCAKNLSADSPYLVGFCPPEDVPEPVLHQYSGAYVAEKYFGVGDEEVLDAIRYHTSGRENMTALGKLIFLSDMLESGRNFDGADQLRKVFYDSRDGLDECLYLALKYTLAYLEQKGGSVYPLTRRAYEFVADKLGKS